MFLIHLSSSSWGCELKCWSKVWRIVWISSSSSWGCELKYQSFLQQSFGKGHPLREDVSWNKENGDGICRTRRSSSSWGCELKFALFVPADSTVPSSSSWGCELKYPTDSDQETGSYRHPLREDVSWNKEVADIKTSDQCHPLREDVSWNDKAVRAVEMCQVILFVRMWVEILKSTVLIIVVAIWFFLWGGELKYPW